MRDVKPEPIPEEAIKVLEGEKKKSKPRFLIGFFVGIAIYLIIRNFA